jgi:hypothetical protein
MGSKYKKKLEQEWEGSGTSKIKAATIRVQADKNITDVLGGKYKRIKRRLK